MTAAAALNVALQSAAVAATLLSFWLLGNKSRSGWAWTHVANACWAQLYILNDLYIALLVPVALTILAERARRNWRRS